MCLTRPVTFPSFIFVAALVISFQLLFIFFSEKSGGRDAFSCAKITLAELLTTRRRCLNDASNRLRRDGTGVRAARGRGAGSSGSRGGSRGGGGRGGGGSGGGGGGGGGVMIR